MLRMRPSRVIACPINPEELASDEDDPSVLAAAFGIALLAKTSGTDRANWLILPSSPAQFYPAPTSLAVSRARTATPYACYAALRPAAYLRCPAGIACCRFRRRCVPQFASGLAVARAPWPFDWRLDFSR